MGHKSNPIGLRLQINRTWDSRWYSEGRNYASMLEEDLKMRKFIPVSVNEDMVGHKLGEFSPTRSFPGHAADKKGKR